MENDQKVSFSKVNPPILICCVVHVGCRDHGGYAASIVSLLNIRFSQDTAIRCMQGYDAAIRFEVAPVFTGSNADKEGASG